MTTPIFRLPDVPAYPKGNTPGFEQWFFDGHTHIEGRRRLIPVWWTSYYRQHGYGKDKVAMAVLDAYLQSLDRNEKWFAVVQYDDGILNDISHLDVRVFAMSGPRIDRPLPLVCQPHEVLATREPRKYLASFVGSDTHPIRRAMMDYFVGKPHIYIHEGHLRDNEEYHRILSQSVYALCPRGYGQTSFRIMESVRQGAIPVYISEDFVVPYNYDFRKYGRLWDVRDHSGFDMLHDAMLVGRASEDSISPYVFDQLFSFQAVKDYIESNI